MQIDLTKQEYRDLIDMLFVAHWLLNAHRVGEARDEVTQYNQLEQKLLSFAPELGFGDLVEYAPEQDAYFTTRKYEELPKPQAYINQYDNDTFWVELIERLAERDLVRQAGGYEQAAKFQFEERMQKMLDLENRYSIEFQENGLDNLQVTHSSGRHAPLNGS